MDGHCCCCECWCRWCWSKMTVLAEPTNSRSPYLSFIFALFLTTCMCLLCSATFPVNRCFVAIVRNIDSINVFIQHKNNKRNWIRIAYLQLFTCTGGGDSLGSFLSCIFRSAWPERLAHIRARNRPGRRHSHPHVQFWSGAGTLQNRRNMLSFVTDGALPH